MKDSWSNILEIGSTEYSNTITSVAKDNYVLEMIVGNIYPSNGQNGNVYTTDNLAPAILSGQGDVGRGIGSNNAPKVLEVWMLPMKGKGHEVTARNIALGDAHTEARPLTTDPWDNAILTEDETDSDRQPLR